MGGDTPKQFLHVAGKSLLGHAVDSLATDSRIERIFIVTMPEDPYSERISAMPGLEAAMVLPCGGATRANTVLNGLQAIEKLGVLDNDWVLVHDAARPCLSSDALNRLLEEVGSDVVGGILAVPVTDTLKRADVYSRSVITVPRGDLWQAQTPQMFRVGTLRNALMNANLENMTDEASAIEAAGMRPKLVMGERSNIKVTYTDDLPIVEWLLARRSEQVSG